MKILMTGLLPFNPKINNGGVVSVIRNLLESFSGMEGLEVCHVSFNKDVDRPKKLLPASNITLRFIPFKSKFDLWDYWANRKTLEAIIAEEKPDLIHIQEITPQVLRFIHLNREKIVVTQHGIMSEELKHLDRTQARAKGLFKALIEKFIFPLFPNVIFISAYNQKLFPVQPDHSDIILNPVSRLFFAEESSLGDPRSLAIVGAFSRIKNIELALSVMARLKKEGLICRLHLAGGFKTNHYENFIINTVNNLGLNDQVIFHGWCSKDKVRSLLGQCSIFLLPSRQETLPVAIGEAMATGRVVVAADVGAVSEMITNGESGFLFPNNDEEALLALLKFLLTDSVEMKRVARNARQTAEKKFHPDIIAAKTARFYQQVHHHAQGIIKVPV